MDDFKKYIEEHPQKEGSFVLCNIAGFEWHMLKDGKVLSALPNHMDKFSMIASSNTDANEDTEVIKKMVVAILKEKIYNSIQSMEILAEEAGHKDFKITYDEIVEMFSGEL